MKYIGKIETYKTTDRKQGASGDYKTTDRKQGERKSENNITKPQITSLSK